MIVTADKDLSQLIGAHDQIWDFAKNHRYGCDGVRDVCRAHWDSLQLAGEGRSSGWSAHGGRSGVAM